MKTLTLLFMLTLLFTGCAGGGDTKHDATDSNAVKTADSASKMKDTIGKMMDSAKTSIKVSLDTSLK